MSLANVKTPFRYDSEQRWQAEYNHSDVSTSGVIGLLLDETNSGFSLSGNTTMLKSDTSQITATPLGKGKRSNETDGRSGHEKIEMPHLGTCHRSCNIEATRSLDQPGSPLSVNVGSKQKVKSASA